MMDSIAVENVFRVLDRKASKVRKGSKMSKKTRARRDKDLAITKMKNGTTYVDIDIQERDDDLDFEDHLMRQSWWTPEWRDPLWVSEEYSY